MKKLVSILLAAALLISAAACAALAEGEDLVYGTMQIPYAAFYAAEGVTTEVDAVTSATNSKWKNEGLVAGSYYAEHADDEGGDILGVVYPVAITQTDLDALGEENYGFTTLDEVPAAYKCATLADGALTFSELQGEAFPLKVEEVVFDTESKYGDYQIEVKSINNKDGHSDIGTIYGVLLKTEAGDIYGLRHLENIWQDKLAFSVGFKTTESHGNALKSEAYQSLMGQTISEITYITDTGRYAIGVSLYVAEKFDGGVAVADAPVAGGTADVTLTGFPEDFARTYAVKGLEAECSDEAVSFAEALPGSYTLVVSDANGKYADVKADFVLSTDVLPVAYDAETASIVATEGADADLAAAFLANLSTVTVNGSEYLASGKHAVAIIDVEGAVDPEAALVEGKGENAVTTPIFAEEGDYELTVASVGFDQALTFTYSK